MNALAKRVSAAPMALYAAVGALTLAVACYVQATMASTASAAVEFEAKDVIEPIETTVSAALPLLIGIVVALIAYGFVSRRAKREVK